MRTTEATKVVPNNHFISLQVIKKNLISFVLYSRKGQISVQCYKSTFLSAVDTYILFEQHICLKSRSNNGSALHLE